MEVSCLYSLVILPAAFTTISFRSYFKKPYFWIDSGYLEREIEKLFSFWTWWSSTFYNAGWRVFFQTSFIPPGQRHEWFLSRFLLVCTLFFLFWMRTVMFSLPGVTRLCIRHFLYCHFLKPAQYLVFRWINLNDDSRIQFMALSETIAFELFSNPAKRFSRRIMNRKIALGKWVRL